MRYDIQLEGAEVSYPQNGGDRKVVVSHLDLRIREGEIVTVVGPSGCGKSTVFRLILGSQSPTRGVVHVLGNQVEHVTSNCGIVFQRYTLYRHLTVIQNIAFGIELRDTEMWQRFLHTPFYRRVRKGALEEARRYLGKVGLSPDDADKYPDELSGGMQQRVAIAQALILKPKIILMDEPFGALDKSTREDMQMLVLDEWREHKPTILFVTHDLDEALILGTRLIGLTQFWKHDNGDKAEGSRVTQDREIPGGHPKPSDWRFSPEFKALRDEIAVEVLDPDHLQRVSDFDLLHKDACKV